MEKNLQQCINTAAYLKSESQGNGFGCLHSMHIYQMKKGQEKVFQGVNIIVFEMLFVGFSQSQGRRPPKEACRDSLSAPAGPNIIISPCLWVCLAQLQFPRSEVVPKH